MPFLDGKPVIITKRNVDKQGNPISVKQVETKQVVDIHNSIPLNYSIDRNHPIVIKDLHQIYNKDEISENTFWVDYDQGILYFHPKLVGKSLTITYMGTGYILISSDRIYRYNKGDGTSATESIEASLEKLENILNTITQGGNIAGNIEIEVIGSRTDAQGQTFPSLGDRLNYITAQLESSRTISASNVRLDNPLFGGATNAQEAFVQIDIIYKEVIEAREKADGTQFNTLGERLNKADADFDLLNKEVIDARTDKAGTTHKDLKTRLDNVDSQLDSKADLNIVNNVLKTSFNNKPIITLLDDDCRREFLTIIKPELDKRGLKSSLALITSKVADSDTLTLEELKQLQDDGFDILCHSHTHSYDIYKNNILTQDDSIIENDIKLAQNYMRKNGFNIGAETLVYPFGNYTGGEAIKIKSIVRKYFTNAIDAGGGMINHLPYDNCLIPRKIFEFKQASNLDYAKQLIDECKTSNAWFILGTHAWSNVDQAMYGQMLDYLVTSGVAVMTFSEALKYKGNVLSVGEYTSDNRFFISCNGNIETSKISSISQNLLKQTETFNEVYWIENDNSTTTEIRKNAYKGRDALVLIKDWQAKKQKVYLEKDKTYTCSVVAKASKPYTTIGLYTYKYVGNFSTNLSTNWRRYSVTFTHDRDSGEYFILPESSNITTIGGEVLMCAYQLEEGENVSEFIVNNEDLKYKCVSNENKLIKSKDFDSRYWKEALTNQPANVESNAYNGLSAEVITIHWQGKKQKVYLQKDNIYTLSFYAISTDANNSIGFYTNEFVKSIIPSTNWERYSVTFKYKGESGGEFIILQANKAVVGNIKICGIQLEDGLIMSEYKESKEDFKV